MANKKAESEKVITLSYDDAQQIVDLFTNVESADAHFQTCQSDLFRQHVQSCYKAGLVDAAYQRLKEQLKHEEE